MALGTWGKMSEIHWKSTKFLRGLFEQKCHLPGLKEIEQYKMLKGFWIPNFLCLRSSANFIFPQSTYCSGLFRIGTGG